MPMPDHLPTRCLARNAIITIARYAVCVNIQPPDAVCVNIRPTASDSQCFPGGGAPACRVGGAGRPWRGRATRGPEGVTRAAPGG
eukprot:764569-Prorocentrum_minimum.AAC.1